MRCSTKYPIFLVHGMGFREGKHIGYWGRIPKILEENGAEKVSIIAHSKGGLVARCLISSMGMADRIASLTTLSTPHKGSVTVDNLIKLPHPLVKFGCSAVNLWFRIFGDASPDTYNAVCSFRIADAEKFNAENPDAEGIYYQSMFL